MHVIAGDIGGTNLRLAVVELAERPSGGGAGERWPASIAARRTLPVAEQPDLATPLAAFVREAGDRIAAEGAERPTRACLGIAGTVRGDRVEGVNLPWTIAPAEVARAAGLERLRVVNDFHAAARGVELLTPADLLALGGGAPAPAAPIAILGAGTGLGQAFLLPEPGGGFRVVPTEGGHRDFAPRDDLQDRLLVFLRRRHGRVSTERVLSGPGLEAIYVFLVEVEGRGPAADVEAAPPGERARTISRLGLASAHPTCAEALGVFVAVYGAEAGDVVLTALAAGGAYLAGGIAPELFGQPALDAAFRRAFEHKGRFSGYLAEVPVWAVLNEDLGILGAANEVARY